MLRSLAALVLPLAFISTTAHADVLKTYSFQALYPYSTTGSNPNLYQGLVGTFTEDLTTNKFVSWNVYTDGGPMWQFSNHAIGGETLTVINNNLDNGLWQTLHGYGRDLTLELSPMGESGWGAGYNDGAFIETAWNQYEYRFSSRLVSETSVPEPYTPALISLGCFAMFMVCRRKSAL